MIFKQQSNWMLAIGFIGFIIILQLWVLLIMKYQMPWYFFLILGIMCLVIIWGLVDNDCKIEGETLFIKSGPFQNKIDINSIDRVIKNPKTLFKRKNSKSQLTIIYNKNQRMNIFPVRKREMLSTLKKVNSAISVE